MKKFLLTIAVVFMVGFSASAQGHDGFIMGGNSGDRLGEDNTTLPGLPHGGIGAYDNDQPAPLGGGLLVLTALGVGYAMAQKRKND